MRVLLLGGTGFLGRHVAAVLLKGGHGVSVLTRGSRPLLPGVGGLEADRHDTVSLARVLEGRRFDFTVDFAAYDAADIERLLLVPYATLGRLVMISTGQVCLVTEARTMPYREEDSEGPLSPEPDRDSPDHPEWTYGVKKRRAEGALLALRASHGVRGVVLRLPIVQGEGDGTLRLWAYLERMLDGGPILLPEGGQQPTRFLYAGDLAAAIVRLLEREPPPEAVYNLAQPDVISLRDTLEQMARLAGVEPQFVDAGWEEITAAGIDRSFSPYSGRWVSILDPARAAGHWGFVARRLADYLPAVVRWHLEHRPGRSHPGYGQRELERGLAARLKAAALR